MPDYELLINGSEPWPLKDGFSFSEVMNGVSTLSAGIYSETGSYRPPLDDEAVFSIGGSPRIGGIIRNRRERGHAQIGASIVTEVDVAGFQLFGQFRFVSVLLPAGTLASQLTILATYLSTYGVTLSGSQAAGPSMPEFDIVDMRLDAVLNTLAVASAWYWQIDAAKVLRMQAPGTNAAPFHLNESNGVTVGDIVVEESRTDQYANRVYVRSPPIVRNGELESFSGDGVTVKFFPTGTVSRHYGYVTSDGNYETLETAPAGVGVSWEYDPADNSITRLTGAPAAAVGNVIFSYDGVFASEAVAEDAGAIIANGLQEIVLTAEPGLDGTALQALADAELARRLQTFLTVTYRTYGDGLAVGQAQSIVESYRALSGTFLITEVSGGIAADDVLIAYDVTAIGASTFQGSWRDIYKLWAGGSSGSSVSGSVTVGPPGPGGGGSGTVTSVGLTAPSDLYVVAGSPVTTSGILALNLNTQNANEVWAGPTSGADATPTFRGLVVADLPAGGSNTVLVGTGPAYSGTPTVTSLTATGAIAAGTTLAAGSSVSAVTSITAGGSISAGTTVAAGLSMTAVTSITGATVIGTTSVTGDLLIGTTSLTVPLITTAASGNLTLAPTGDIVVDPTGNDLYPAVSYDISLGTTLNKFHRAFIAELVVDTMVAREVVSTIGGSILVATTSELTADAGSGATSITLKHNDFSSGDIIRMEARGQVEFMAMASGPSGGAGVIAYVGRAENTVSPTPAAAVSTASTSHTTGNLLVVCVSRASATAITVADTALNTYTKAGSGAVNGANYVDLYYAWNITGHGSNVVTATLASGTAAYFAVSVREFSGVQTTGDPLDGTAGNSGSGTSVSSGTVTIAASSSVLVSMIEADGDSLAAGSGFALTVFSGGDGVYFADQYKIISASQAADASCGSAGWATMAAAFKVGTAGVGPFTYSVTRNLDGSGANNWQAGDAVVNTGQTGAGHINLYAETGILSGIGPTIVGNVRTGSTYSQIEPRWAIGNLNGLYGYGLDIYGAAFGTPAAAWLKIDPTNGIRIGHNATTKIHLDASGNASFTGAITATSGTIGGWAIGATTLTSVSGTVGIASAGLVSFWAGNANPVIAPFRVEPNGNVVLGDYPTQYLYWNGSSLAVVGAITATSGSFTGSIYAGSGTIGGWTINTNYIASASGTVGMDAVGSIAFWAGSASPAGAPFRVAPSGSMVIGNYGSNYLYWDGSSLNIHSHNLVVNGAGSGNVSIGASSGPTSIARLTVSSADNTISSYSAMFTNFSGTPSFIAYGDGTTYVTGPLFFASLTFSTAGAGSNPNLQSVGPFGSGVENTGWFQIYINGVQKWIPVW